MNEKEMFLNSFDREFHTTVKVLKAFPVDRQDYKPHEKSKSAKELAFIFASEGQVFIPGAAQGSIDWTKKVPMPETMHEVIKDYENIHKENMELIKNTSEEDLNKTMEFFVAPKKAAEMRRMDLLWMFLMDQVHHRGQFSVYLRLVGAKVPSIYGPTADEPWN